MRSSTLFLFLALLLIQPSFALAVEKAASHSGSDSILTVVVVTVVAALVSGLVGYEVGVLKAFREYKQKTYQEILSPILTMAYKREKGEQEVQEFNQALARLWLYASKNVAKKADKAISILHDPKRGDLTKALQETIAVMRRDIQIGKWWQKLDPSEVAHLYSQLSGGIKFITGEGCEFIFEPAKSRDPKTIPEPRQTTIGPDDVLEAFKDIPDFSEEDVQNLLPAVLANLLTNGIVTKELLSALVSSKEILNKIRKLYIELLDRPADKPLDPVAVATWAALLFHYGVRPQIIAGIRNAIAHSPEYNKKQKAKAI